jgi:hypothetical protein
MLQKTENNLNHIRHISTGKRIKNLNELKCLTWQINYKIKYFKIF